MSNAIICDTCTQVFPEGAEGSVSGNGTFTRTVDGVRKELNRRQDQCPECAEQQTQRWNGARTLEPPATERAKREVLNTVELTNAVSAYPAKSDSGRNFTLGGDYE